MGSKERVREIFDSLRQCCEAQARYLAPNASSYLISIEDISTSWSIRCDAPITPVRELEESGKEEWDCRITMDSASFVESIDSEHSIQDLYLKGKLVVGGSLRSALSASILFEKIRDSMRR